MIRNQYKVLLEKYNLVKENEDEDLLAGVDKAFDELSPDNKIVYGTLTLGRNGNPVNYIPINLLHVLRTLCMLLKTCM